MTEWHRGMVFASAAGLFLYAFLWLPWFDGYRAAETLVSVFLLVAIVRFWREWFRWEPLMLLWLLLLSYLLIAQLWYLWALPEGFEPSEKVTRHYLKPVLVLMVGVMVMQLGRRFLFWWLTAAVAGLLLYLLMNVDINYWQKALAGRRVDFGMRNAQHAGLVFGALLLSAACYLPRVILARMPFWPKVGKITAVSLLLILAVICVLVTQVRGVWLGLGAAALVMLAAFCLRLAVWGGWPIDEHSSRIKGLAAVLTVAALLAMTGAITELDERVVKRFGQADVPWEQFTGEAEPGELSMDSAGVRVASWWAAADWIAQRPGFGWGAGAVEPLIDRSEQFSPRFKRRFGHLHNMYLEALVAHGIVGGLLFLVLFGWITCSVWLSYRRGVMPADAALFGVGFVTFWAAANLFESYYLYTSGQYVATLGFGFLYSFYFQSRGQPMGDT